MLKVKLIKPQTTLICKLQELYKKSRSKVNKIERKPKTLNKDRKTKIQQNYKKEYKTYDAMSTF